MLYTILKWFRGYLLVRIYKGYPERFFNVCRKHQMYIWDITTNDNVYSFKIKLYDYKKINDIAYKCKTYPIINKKIGFPFVLNAIIKRKTLLPSFLLFLLTIIYLSGFIWNISVSGQNRYTKEALVEYMETIGLKEYMRKNKLDADYVEKKMRIDYKDIGWVSVSLDGTNVMVKILESDMPDINTIQKKYSDIVASDDGVVYSIVTRSGVPKVKAGDKVKKGQILVSGIIELYDDTGVVYKKNPVAADADIIIKVRKKYNNFFTLIHDKKKYTGRNKCKYTICSKNNLFFVENILNKFESYEKYDIINENMYYGYLNKKTIYEYEIVGETYNKNEALLIAKQNLNNYINRITSENIEIINKNVKVKFDNNICKSYGWIDMFIRQTDRKLILEKDWGVEKSNERYGNNN